MTKIQCKNINVNIIYDIQNKGLVMEAFAWVRIVKDDDFYFKLVIHERSATSKATTAFFLTYTILQFPC